MSDDVSVKFGANIDGVVAGINHVKDQVESMGTQLNSIAGAFTSFGTIVAEAFAIEQIQHFVEKIVDVGVDMERMKAQLGETTEGFNILRTAAEGSDTKMELLTRSITQFDRMAEQTTNTNSRASQAFRVFGIDAQNYLATGHSLDDLFKMTVGRMSEYKDSMEKSAAISMLFGGRSAQLIKVLDNLGTKTKEYAEMNERAGVNVEGFGEASEDTKSKLVELDMATLGLKETLFMKLKPAIDLIEGGIINLVEGFNEWMKDSTLLDGYITTLMGVMKGFASGMMLLATSIGNVFQLAEASMHAWVETMENGFKAGQAAWQEDMDKILKKNEDTYGKIATLWADDPTVPKGAAGGPTKSAKTIADPAETKRLMDEDIAIHKSALDLEVEQAGEDLKKKKALYDEFYRWLAQKYPQNTKALNDALRQSAQIENQEIKKEEASWNHFFGNFNNGINGMIKGTMTFKTAMQNAAMGIVDTWIKNIEKIVSHWIATEIIKTEATAAGNAARTASDEAASKASGGFSAGNAIKTITGDAAKAYAGTYGFLAPEMGPFAAIPAGLAFAAVMGMEALVPSFAVGTWNVPHDMMANLHAGERVMTAEENRSYSANGGGDSGKIEMHFHGPTDKQYFMANSGHIADALAKAGRNFSPAIQKAKKL